jgi:hypothetical protein
MANLTFGTTINWDLNNQQVATVTLIGSATLANPTNKQNGGTYMLIVVQDNIGGRSLNFGTDYKFPNGSVIPPSLAANSRTIYSFISDGTRMFVSGTTNYPA